MVCKLTFTNDENHDTRFFGEIFKNPLVRPQRGDTIISETGVSYEVKQVLVSSIVDQWNHKHALYEFCLEKTVPTVKLDPLCYQKETKIILGFPGTGKSYYKEQQKNKNDVLVCKSEPSSFQKEYFPLNYIENIKRLYGVMNIIFCPAENKELRDALRDDEFFKTKKLYICYPDRSLKQEYIERYRDRGDNQEFVSIVANHWDAWIDEIEAEEEPFRLIKLNHDEYITNAVHYLNIEETVNKCFEGK